MVLEIEGREGLSGHLELLGELLEEYHCVVAGQADVTGEGGLPRDLPQGIAGLHGHERPDPLDKFVFRPHRVRPCPGTIITSRRGDARGSALRWPGAHAP